MIFIFFIYGLAFFVLGVTVATYPRAHSKFLLAENVWLIAAFGIMHGLNEWIDMFIMIQKPFDIVNLRLIKSIFLPVSFICLYLFGIKSIPGMKKRQMGSTAVLGVLIIIFVLIVVKSSQRYLMADIWARYLLAVPGIVLTFLALTAQEKVVRKSIVSKKTGYLKWSAYAFLSYSFFSGLIVPEAGFFPANLLNYFTFKEIVVIPVQVFRTLCAVLILYGTIGALRIFDWETTEALKRSREELEIRVKERTRELTDALDQIKVLSGFLPICASCKKIRDDKGYWNQIEEYIRDHSEAEFSHSICPDCANKLYSNIKKKEEDS
jgi:hypothetical protein